MLRARNKGFRMAAPGFAISKTAQITSSLRKLRISFTSLMKIETDGRNLRTKGHFLVPGAQDACKQLVYYYTKIVLSKCGGPKKYTFII